MSVCVCVQWAAVNVFLHRQDSNRWSRWWKMQNIAYLRGFFLLALRTANAINSIYLQFRFGNYTTLIILSYDIVRVFTCPLYMFGSCRKSEIWEHKIAIPRPSPSTAVSSNGPFRCGWLSIICHLPLKRILCNIQIVFNTKSNAWRSDSQTENRE